MPATESAVTPAGLLIAGLVLAGLVLSAPSVGAEPADYLPPAPGDVKTVFVPVPATGEAAAEALTRHQRAQLAEGWVVTDVEHWHRAASADGFLVTYTRR